MHKNVSMKDVELIREIVTQKNVLDFFKYWLESNDVSFFVTKAPLDMIEIKCKYLNQKIDLYEEYKFMLKLNYRDRSEVSVLLEGLYSSDEIDILLQSTRMLMNQIDSHLRLIEHKEKQS